MIAPSNNFTVYEWVASRDHPQLATPLESLGLERVINCMRLNLLFMQPTRDLVSVLKVLSWCRSEALNSAVGGVKRSSHLTGLACDFVPRAVPTERLLYLAVTGELAKVGAKWDKLNFYSDRGFYHVALQPVESGPSRMRIYRDWNRIEVKPLGG